VNFSHQNKYSDHNLHYYNYFLLLLHLKAYCRWVKCFWF